jgi:hypothetical protein
MKGTKKMMMGGMTAPAGAKAPMMPKGAAPMRDEEASMDPRDPRKKKKKMLPPRVPSQAPTAMGAPAGMKSGGMAKKGYKSGGKVRGAGCAKQGVRGAKMVTMKGS